MSIKNPINFQIHGADVELESIFNILMSVFFKSIWVVKLIYFNMWRDPGQNSKNSVKKNWHILI